MFSASNVPHRNRNRLRNSSEDPGRVWLAKPLCASCVCICAIRTIQSRYWQWQIANHFVHRAFSFVQYIQYNPGGMIGNQQTTLQCMLLACVCAMGIFIQRSGSSLTGKPLCAFPSLLCTKHMCTLCQMCISKCVVCLDGSTAWRHCWCLLAPPWWCHRPRQRN